MSSSRSTKGQTLCAKRWVIPNSSQDCCCQADEYHIGCTAGICRTSIKLKKKRHRASDKQKLDNAPKLRGVYFFHPYDMEFEDTMKNARKKLEAPLEFAMPCKMRSVTMLMDTCSTNNPNTRKTRAHASLMHTNLPESALKGLKKKSMRITLLRNGSIR